MINYSIKKVIVDNISKSFNVGFKKSDGVLARFLNTLTGRESKRSLQILNDVSLTVAAGENVGLIGNNGSGKSTLLRLIASIYQTKQGKIITNGEVVYMNGFGLGLKPRLTMKDNIYLIASLMGLSRQEIKKRFTEIVEFSELEDYVNTKVYQFSYGMISRLCFSTTIHCLEQKNPDIILLDEVFGTGGDLAFQNKAIAKMEEFIKGGAAVILVSHDLNIIQQYCDRVIWLKNGQVIRDGKPQDIVKEYIADTQAILA